MRMSEERGLHAVRARAREEQAALYAATGRFREAYDEHRAFHAAATALHSAQREARARALQAVFEATEARRASEHFREMAHRDALTGLYNRRYVNERLPALLGEAVATAHARSRWRSSTWTTSSGSTTRCRTAPATPCCSTSRRLLPRRPPAR